MSSTNKGKGEKEKEVQEKGSYEIFYSDAVCV